MNDAPVISLPTEKMQTRIEGPIGWMTFNNPARRNAVSLDMWAVISTILDRFESDPAVRVIVLHGAGEAAFVAGADISQFEKTRSSADENAQYDRAVDEASRRLYECSKPTVDAPMTINALKQTVGELVKGADADLAVSERLVKACFESQDFIEGRRAFMEKRRPVFRGV